MRFPNLLHKPWGKVFWLAFLILSFCLPGYGYRSHKASASSRKHASAKKTSSSRGRPRAAHSRTARSSSRSSHSHSRRVQTRVSQSRSGRGRSGHRDHSRGRTRVAQAAPRRSHGQQAIHEDRTTEIQAALIRDHYLQGEPSGTWDDSTKEAMRRYQSDNGWQTKIMPDSRALIKMGLGPSHERDINASGPLSQGLPRPRSSANQPESPESPQQ